MKRMTVSDQRGRGLSDLRISVTDRCNFRCRYCMPREQFDGYRFSPRSELLTFEEITRVSSIFASLGVRKFRLTGGEPLLRAEIEKLVALLARIEGAEVALTTNGVLLSRRAAALKAAGLSRVTVSLDSLDDDVFRTTVDADFRVADVLAGIEAAERAGLTPIKINAVVRRGKNDAGIVALARRFQGSGHIVRFIEFMDVGTTNGWQADDVVPAREIVERIHRELPLEPLDPNYPGEVARRWRYADGSGEIGVISSVTQPFCGDCSRARLSAVGTLYTCLFAASGTDLRGPLRDSRGDDAVSKVIEHVWRSRTDRYSETRTVQIRKKPRIEMSYIGG
jgi:cyclic pyranopterin phosphate synthase